MMRIENERRWEMLEAQLAAAQPGILQALRPPASLNEIRAVENEIGLVFPDDLRDAYLRHDGIDWAEPGQARPVLLPAYAAWLPLELVLDSWRHHVDIFSDCFADMHEDHEADLNEYPDEKVRSQFLLPEWIPIGKSSGIAVCIDLVPGPAGVSGQLIRYDYSGGATVVSNGIGGYLDLLIASLANGTGSWRDGELVLGVADAAELAAVTQSPVVSAETQAVARAIELPTITRHPASACIDAGADAIFSVTATGGADLRYQWYRNGLALPGGDTSEVRIPTKVASIGESFQITVQVSNPAGAVTSEPMAMTVTHPVGGVVVEQAIKAAQGGRLTIGRRVALNIYVGALAADATVRMVVEQADRLGIAADCIPIGDAVTVDTGGVAFATPLWLEARVPDDVAEGRVLAMLELGGTTRMAGDEGADTTPILQVLGLSAHHSQYGMLVAGLQRDGRYLLAQVHESDITGELE